MGNATQTLMLIEVHFLPSKEEPFTRYQPAGLLDGLQTPGDRLLSCSWPSAPPDRDDHFSAKWTGYWQPGKGKREIRLRASHHATLSMDGKPILECQECPAGVTTTLEIDEREHPFQLDYSHTQGKAYIFLDAREPGRAWYPIEVKAERRNEKVEGWKAEYYLGEGFEKLMFARTDLQIAFDWKGEGPFDRPEDLPTLTFRWGHREEAFFGEVSSNRRGFLWFRPYTIRYQGQSGPILKGTNTSFHLVSGEGKTLLDIFFDQGVTWWNSGKESDQVESIKLPIHPELAETGFLVPVQTGKPFRFWEDTPKVEGGAWISKALDSEAKDFMTSRPRLMGDFSGEGEALFADGRWWAKVYLEALRMWQINRKEQSPTLFSPARQRLLASIAANLPLAVSEMVSLCIPDLSFNFRDTGSGQETPAIAGIFQTEATQDLEFLTEALTGLKSPVRKQAIVGTGHSPVSRWPITGLSHGLGNALKNFSEVSSCLKRTSDGGFRFLQQPLHQRTVKLEKWVVADGMSLDFTLSPSGIRIEQKKGAYLQFDRSVAINSFRLGKQGEWISEVQVEGKVHLEAGPMKTIKSVAWNRNPLLMTQQEKRFLRGTLPEGKGEIRVEWVERPSSIPRF